MLSFLRDGVRLGYPFEESIRSWLEHHGNHELVLNPDYKLSFRDKKHRLTRRLENLLGQDFSKRHFRLIT